MKQDIGFKTFPKFKKEFIGNDGLPVYIMDRDLRFQLEEKDFVVKDSDNSGVFYTNLCSVPSFKIFGFKVFWFLHKPTSKQTKKSSALHDFMHGQKSTSRHYDNWVYLIATKSEQWETLSKLKRRIASTKSDKKLKAFIMFNSKRFRYFITRWILFIILCLISWKFKAR